MQSIAKSISQHSAEEGTLVERNSGVAMALDDVGGIARFSCVNNLIPLLMPLLLNIKWPNWRMSCMG